MNCWLTFADFLHRDFPDFLRFLFADFLPILRRFYLFITSSHLINFYKFNRATHCGQLLVSLNLCAKSNFFKFFAGRSEWGTVPGSPGIAMLRTAVPTWLFCQILLLLFLIQCSLAQNSKHFHFSHQRCFLHHCRLNK